MLLQKLGELFRGFDRRRADERRLTARDALANVLDDRLELVRLGQIDEVRMILTYHRSMRRNDDDFEAIDLLELERFRIGGAGHTRKFLIHAEVVLERDRSDRLVLLTNAHAFLCFDSLMQAVRPAAPRHRATREFIDDDDFAIADDVLDVAMVERMRTQRRVQVVHQANVGGVIEALARLEQARLGKQLFRPLVARVGEMDLARFLVGPVVALAFFRFLARQAGCKLIDLDVELGAFFGRAGDDERGTRFVDQNGVDLVDDRIGELTLGAIFQTESEIVAQIVETELVVRAVRNIGCVRGALLFGGLPALDDTDGESEEAINGRHPVRIALRQILVDGDDVNALRRQRVQVSRQRGDERLTLTGAHFRDLAEVQRLTADELHIEVPHPERAPCGLPNGRECLRKQVIERLSPLQAAAKFSGFPSQLLVVEGPEGLFERIRAGNIFRIAMQNPLVAAAEQLSKPIRHARAPGLEEKRRLLYTRGTTSDPADPGKFRAKARIARGPTRPLGRAGRGDSVQRIGGSQKGSPFAPRALRAARAVGRAGDSVQGIGGRQKGSR